MMKKFASFEVLSKVLVPQDAAPARLPSRLGHRAEFQYEPRPGFLYVRSRAISSRCNDNFDEFPAEEIKKAYASFVGKPVFVNHHNDNHRRARGVIIDAALHEDRNHDGTPDTWAEVLMEVDAVRFPKLAKAILAGHIDRTSMGTDVAYSICSACNNKASSPSEYCEHIPRMKGQRIYRRTASGGREGVLIREKCFGLGFFENSLLVEEPADPTAFFLGVDDRGLKMNASRTQPKTSALAEVVHEAAFQDSLDFKGRTVDRNDRVTEIDTRQDKDRAYNSGVMNGHADRQSNLLRTPAQRDALAQSHPAHAQGHFHQGYVDGHAGRSDSRTAAVTDRLETMDPQALARHLTEFHGYQPQQVQGMSPQQMLQIAQAAEASGHQASRKQADKDDSVLCPSCDGGENTEKLGMNEGLTCRLCNDTCRVSPEKAKQGFYNSHVEFDQDLFDRTYDADHNWHRESKRASRKQAASIEFGPEDHAFHQHVHEQGQRDREMSDHAHQRPVDLSDPHDLKAHMFEAHGWDENDMFRNSHPEDHPAMMAATNEDRPLTHEEIRGAHDHEHNVEYPEDYQGAVTLGDSHFHTAARTAVLQVEAAKSDEFFDAHPVNPDHIVEKFKAATPEQHDAGMHWYEDAHHIAKAIGHGDASKAAGLMGVYSAGTPVAPNYHYASRAIIHNTAVGGKTNPIPPEHSDFHGKPNASGAQAEQATRILDGEHHSTVITSPKVSNYAHLIEHGDNEPGRDAPERVVVDRHAISAATNHRITDAEFGSLNLSTTDNGKKIRGGGGAIHSYGDDKNARYHKVANAYRTAAQRLREEGHDVRAHQVQAVAWTVQKAQNDAEDAAHVEANGPLAGNIKGRQNSQERQRNAWETHFETQHDNQGAPANPRGHWGAKTAFGETKAPADVDTLRDEECPVCGERDSYDGNSCQVCGFDAPPQMFRDPDLGKAQQMDLRKDMLQDAGTLPGQDPLDPTAQDANGGLPGEIPGEVVPGSDQVPVDPSMVTPDGETTPQADPAQIAQQQMEQLQSGVPLTPDQLGPNGELGVQVDPEAATGHVNQGGEPFTPGPNAPGEPGEPEGPGGPAGAEGAPVDPEDLDEDGQAPEQQAGDPGTPADGVPDLQCPACGFSADAAQPTSVDMDDLGAPNAGGDGMLAGDVCPQCQKAQMISVGEAETMQQQGVPV